MSTARRPGRLAAIRALLLATIAVLALAITPLPASAAGDIGSLGPSTTGAGTGPTGEKPESKLWWNDGRWWASMLDATSGTYHIFWLDRAAATPAWVDTGTQLDPRAKSRADTLWDGTHLYVASALYAGSNTTGVSGNPTRLYRFSYDALTRSYRLDAGFPVNINTTSLETITLDKDTTGRLWATWAQNETVYYAATTTPGDDASWTTPAALPVNEATGLEADDISTLVAFGKPASAGGPGGAVGIMWSNQTASTTYFSVHRDGDPSAAWSPAESVSVPGPKQSDDHLNIKDLQTDPSGRVFAVIKTSLNDIAGVSSSAPSIVVAARAAKGGWSRATFGTVADCHTRPLLVLDGTNKVVHVYATAPDSGCSFSGAAGTIFEKTSPIDSLSFAAGRGTPVMRDVASPNLNNVSGSKQTVNATTGIVLLASNDVTRRYWFSDETLPAAATAPTAAFSATPTTGTAPLPVQFTDASTGGPTAWAWDFGDGTTSTAQSPQHTYSAPGTYTVKLTASNAAGASAPATSTVTVAAAPVHGITAVGAAGAVSTAAVTSVPLTAPSGVTAGDVLVASITADNSPTVTAPAGWTPIVTALKVGSGAVISAYYHVLQAGETQSYSWTLSSAQKWGGGISAFRGVDTTQPLDLATASTSVNSSGTATSISPPALTTVTAGAMLVGGLGADGSTATTTAPTGWTEGFDSLGGQMTEQAWRLQAAAGTTGAPTWTITAARALGAWFTALRPA